MGILREVLAGICAASGKDKSSGWLVASYKDKKDFAYLWDDEFLERVKAGEHRNLVIVWDGMPEPDGSGVNVLDHITPVDWAMALSHRLLQGNIKDTSITIPELRILICDISQQNHASAFSVRMLPAICHGMPWLRVYRPIESDKRFGRDFEMLVDDIKQFDPNKFPSLKDAQPDMIESLVHAWIGSVAESGSHHDVSNLLAPMVLSTGFNNSSLHEGLLEGKPARIALLQKIKWLGMGGGKENPQENWFDFSKDAAKIVRDSRVKIILIDDQANQGWLDIVSAAVGAVRPDASEASENEIKLFAKSDVVEVHASKSYLAIKSRLEDAGISDKEGSNINGDQRFKFSLTGEGAEILLLDLRLFFNEQKEIEYLEWALGVAKNLKRANEAVFLDIKCDHLGGWLSKAKESKSADWRKETEYLELLTLLPRILATIDMSMPIVIFSSTGQRQVTELLKDYRNIITVFNKPGFFGYASGSLVEDTKQKFVAAMQAAIHILQARVAMQELLVNFPSKDGMEPQIDGQPQQEKYVEIFIDESGEPEEGKSFVVAGIALVHESIEQARKLHTAMENTLVRLTDETADRKLKWYGDGCMPKRLGDAHNRKSLFQPVIAPLQNLFGDHSAGFVSFAISAKLDELKCSGKLKGLAKHNLDSAYLELFEWLVDVVLYEFLPEKLGCQSKLKFKIYGATRVRTKDDQTLFSSDEKAALTDNWGISNIYQGKYQSLNEMSFMPLVVNVLSGRPHPKAEYMSDGSSISGAVGFSLKYEDQSPPNFGVQRDFFRHAHYIADLVANSAYISLNHPDRDIFKGFFNARFIDAFDDSFKAAVDASKYLESGQRVEGFLRAVGAGRYHVAHRKQTCPESIVGTILRKISGEAGKLTREEFYEFSNALGKWWNDYENSSAIDRLPGKAYGEDSYSGLRTGEILPKSPRPANQSATSRESQNKNHGTTRHSSPPWNPGLFITLAGLNENLKDDKVIEIVRDVLREELAQSMGLSIDITKSKHTKKMVCKISCIPEHEYENIHKKLFDAKGDSTWRNCARPPSSKPVI